MRAARQYLPIQVKNKQQQSVEEHAECSEVAHALPVCEACTKLSHFFHNMLQIWWQPKIPQTQCLLNVGPALHTYRLHEPSPSASGVQSQAQAAICRGWLETRETTTHAPQREHGFR